VSANTLSEHHDNFEVFQWNANFDTGLAIIDEQHKRIIDLLNKLARTLIKEDDIGFTDVFEQLTAYANYHFETEEAIWIACFGDDEWLVSHQSSHASFLPAIVDLKKNYADRPLKDSLREILKFLIRWLVYHIIDSDKRMAIVVNHMGTGTSLAQAKKISAEEMLNSDQILIDTILSMYDELSARTLKMMQERAEREIVTEKLSQANRELEKLATTDQLTGLYNRRHFLTVFEQELRRAKREQHFITFMMLDLDYFKRLNDDYGHLHGDAALNQVSQKLMLICRRPGDFVFRLGGEEFGILLTDQNSIPSGEFAETIRAEIEDLKIPNVGSQIADYLTVSIGVISKIPDASDELESYMKAADSRLYKAKAKGRNQVIDHD